MSELARRIVDAMHRDIWQFSRETQLHVAISAILDRENISYLHEHVLDPKNRIDFYVPVGRLGIEAKVKGSQAQIERQLARYCEQDAIDELVVVSTKLYRYPEALCGKPIVSCPILRSIC